MPGTLGMLVAVTIAVRRIAMDIGVSRVHMRAVRMGVVMVVVRTIFVAVAMRALCIGRIEGQSRHRRYRRHRPSRANQGTAAQIDLFNGLFGR